MVDTLRFFAAPVATITAAIIAASIASYFAWHQKNIAYQQKEVAQEKLRLDLFEKRFRVFSSIFDYYNVILSWKSTEDQKKIRTSFFRSYQEAKFLFGSEVEVIFKKVFDDGSKVIGHKENRENYKNDPEFAMRMFEEQQNILIYSFEDHLNKLTEAVRPYISFHDIRIL